jgi:hypothetical protein
MSQGIKATETALNSEGSALQENEKYLDSINGKLSQLAATFEKLSMNAINGNAIKFFVDFSRIFLEITDKIGLVNIALLALAGTLAGKGHLVLGMSAFANKLSAVITGLGMSAKAATALSAALSVMIPIAVIIGTIALFRKLTVTIEEQIQKVEEAIGAYESNKSELESVSSEIENVKAKLEELNKIENPTFIQKSEIENLKKANSELATRIILLGESNRKAAEAANLELNKLYQKQFEDPNYATVGQYIYGEWLSPGSLDSSGNANFQKAITKYNELTALGDKRTEQQKQELEYAKETVLALGEQYQYLASNYNVVDSKSSAMKIALQGLADLAAKTLDPNQYNSRKFNEIFSGITKDANSKLTQLAKSGKLTADVFTKQFPQIADSFEMVGISAEEAVTEILALSNTGDTVNFVATAFYGLEEALSGVAEASQEVQKQFSTFKSNIDTLNGAIDTLNEGEELTQKDILDLVATFPKLFSQLQKTNKGYELSIDSLEAMRDASIEEAKLAVQAQIDKTKNILESTTTIIGAYKQQILAIKSLQEAEVAVSKNATGLFGLDYTKFDFEKNTYNGTSLGDMSADAIQTLKDKVTLTSSVYELGRLYDQLELLENTNWSAYGGSSSTGKAKDAFKEMNEAFQEQIDIIEHQVYLLSRQEGAEQEQIELYKPTSQWGLLITLNISVILKNNGGITQTRLKILIRVF